MEYHGEVLRDSSDPRTVPTGRSMADEAVRRGAIDLAQGVLHCEPPSVLLDILTTVAHEPRAHAYASPQGVPTYLDALVALLTAEGIRVTSANLLGSSGNTGGLMAALIEHCQPGDRVLLPEPFYPAHLWAVRAARCEPVFVRHAADFSSDQEDLAALLPTVRAALLCNPSNPSGVVWDRERLKTLLAQTSARGTLLIVDETYKDYIWEREFASPLTFTENWENLVVLRGFSKAYAIAGWRVGYAVGAPERIARMTNQIHDALYVGAPSLPQHVLARALRERRPELATFVQRNVGLYRQARQEIADVFRSIGMEPVLPRGAFYMLVRHHGESDVAIMKDLLAKGVAVAPGQAFFRDPAISSGTIRVHFAVPPETIVEIRRRLGVPR